ncbi:MAG TPA: hypothetical protein VGF94_27770 [Kofleriaceae bacterium]|jgi:hypothetical protein
MSIFRYIVQGVGWEIGRSAAREGIEALDQDQDAEEAAPAAPAPDPKLERQRERAAELAREQRAAKIEAELRELKKRR